MKKLFNKYLHFVLVSFSIFICSCQNSNSQEIKTMIKDDNYWKDKLTEEEYYILRQKGTERPFTGKYDKHFAEGIYVCAACENVLFDSETKFDAHCGWPSFDQAKEGSVKYVKDTSYGMQRVEVICANCDGHLGHVFDDGPQETTGMRYCINSISMKFIPKS